MKQIVFAPYRGAPPPFLLYNQEQQKVIAFSFLSISTLNFITFIINAIYVTNRTSETNYTLLLRT